MSIINNKSPFAIDYFATLGVYQAEAKSETTNNHKNYNNSESIKEIKNPTTNFPRPKEINNSIHNGYYNSYYINNYEDKSINNIPKKTLTPKEVWDAAITDVAIAIDNNYNINDLTDWNILKFSTNKLNISES